MKGIRNAAVALAMALAVGACDDSTGPDGLGPEDLDALATQELAVVATDGAVQDVGFMNKSGTPGLRFPFFRFPDFTGDKPDCPEEGGQFRCGARKGMEGLDVTRSLTFYDQFNGAMEGYNPEFTARIEFQLAVEGTVERLNFTANVHRDRYLEVSGLLDDETERTWNGNGTSDVSREGTLPNGAYHNVRVQKASQILGVVVPVPVDDEVAWPTEGQIVSEATITHTTESGEVQVTTKKAVIEFDGDSTATLTIDGESQEVDLSQRPGPRFAREGHRHH